MKQIIQSFKTGQTELEDVPAPVVGKGNLLIQSTYSLVSLGTERMLVEFGKSNLISKARQQPDKVKQVLDKMRSEGIMPTLEAVFNKLEQPIPLGYCNVGKVVAVGEGVSGFKIGDRVASNGHHAEYVAVPQNLVAKIPDNISDEEAAFTVIGAIGLQGIRLLNPTFGETVVVIGLGLIGLLTAQMLKANGCKVIGIDLSEQKCALAQSWGIQTINPGKGDEVVKSVMTLTNQIGADGVLITASAKSNDIISQSAQMSRKRGRIILVGVIGLDISRADFYEKELSFQVSCSYGPGRYDENYEQKGIDYPLPYVRWTEKRNFEAVLQSISAGQLKVNELITEIVDLQDYQKIYGNIGQSSSIASLLRYPEHATDEISHTVKLHSGSFSASKGVVGIIGAGNFTKMTMLPSLKGSGANYKCISSANGVTGTLLAKKHGFAASTTDNNAIYADSEIDLVMITTRHNKHAEQVIQSLQAGKHVFVEKPLALNHQELDAIIEAYEQSASKSLTLTVGFNRRFSPHAIAIKKAIGTGPINIIATMNAGNIPPNVWVHDLQVGGGRIIGEACHFIDLCAYLTGSKVVSVCMNAMGTAPNAQTDNASILLRFADGSNAVINYFSNGSKVYSKERLEVYSQDRTIIMDNFRKTEAFGFKGFKGLRTSLDKGHKTQFHELIRRVKEGGEALIPFDSIVNTTRASFAAIKSLQAKAWVDVK
jgi:predicted dehydrogenase/threonine dehydrogenase-like Zn-dependent dehydrogenase